MILRYVHFMLRGVERCTQYYTQGLILPGQKVEISITAYVDDALASQLNVGQTRLEDTLVLHTALGRDHFVAVSGEYGTRLNASDIVAEPLTVSRTHLLCV